VIVAIAENSDSHGPSLGGLSWADQQDERVLSRRVQLPHCIHERAGKRGALFICRPASTAASMPLD
jgi:hypothetical protein